MHFNLSLRPPHQLRIKEPGERKEKQTQYGMKAITSSSDHQQLLLEKLNARQSTVGGAMWLKKWQLLVAIAIIAELPPTSEPCRTVTVLCCVHHTLEKQTSMNKISEFVG